jgi:hypothetical protein
VSAQWRPGCSNAQTAEDTPHRTAAGRTIRVLPRLPHRCPSTRPAAGSADWPTEALNHSHEHHHVRLDH